MPKKYSLTDEHRAQLKPWSEKWIRNAMSTTAMTEEDRMICIGAVKRLYRAANLEPPPNHRIIFVPSPFVMRFAAGFAAWIWYLRKNKGFLTRAATSDATHAATYAATDAATSDATSDATRAATSAATYAATSDATRAATHAATSDATRAATHAATDAATSDENNWFVLNGDLVRLAEELGVGKVGLQCAYNVYRFCQGGNQWSGWEAFLSFFRHIVKLDVNYTVYDPWETLSLHSGPRAVHAEFCIISDRPEVLLVDDKNRPHCATGPFCRWRDGSELYSFHGTRVPAKLIRHPEKITAKEILAEQNAEVRRVMVELVGMERFLAEAGASCIHSCPAWEPSEQGVTTEVSRAFIGNQTFKFNRGTWDLFSIDLPGDPDRVLRSVRVKDPSTGRLYFLRVPPSISRADDAVAWTFGFDTAKQYKPLAES